jgi:hypothetical protein
LRTWRRVSSPPRAGPKLNAASARRKRTSLYGTCMRNHTDKK